MIRVTIRNVLVLFGSYYVAAFVGMPGFIVFAKLTEGRIYHGDVRTLAESLTLAIPLIVDAILAAVMAGVVIETRAPVGWALGLAALLLMANLSSHRWFRPPTPSDRVDQVVQASAPAIISVPIFLLASRRTRSRSSGQRSP